MIFATHLKKLCEEYAIGDYVAHREIKEGILNQNYFLKTTQGNYFVKSVREKSKDRIVTTFEVETYMKSQGIPAVVMLPTKAGRISVTMGDEALTLYPFIESDRSHSYLNADFRKMGEMLAKIHRAGSRKLPDSLRDVKKFVQPESRVTAERLKEYKNEILGKHEQDETDRLFVNYIDFKLSIIPRLESVELPNDTLTHGDYHPGNILFEKKSRKIIGVCDWEKAEIAPRSYELARSLFYTCFNDVGKIEGLLEHSREFCSGYFSVYPMDAEEMSRGLALRLSKMALSSWIEETYYQRHDDRANRFIKNEMHILNLAVNKKLLDTVKGSALNFEMPD
ncbi:MAG: phosphotransferase [Candidatus Taylorbacteria bacterium]